MRRIHIDSQSRDSRQDLGAQVPQLGGNSSGLSQIRSRSPPLAASDTLVGVMRDTEKMVT